MSDAATIRFGDSLRQLFAEILVFATPVNPSDFWEKHKYALAEDYAKKAGRSTANETDIKVAMKHVQRHLLQYDLNLSDHFGLHVSDEIDDGDDAITPDPEYDTDVLAKIWSENYDRMNNDQKKAFDQIINSVEGNEGKLFVLDAPGGTGKTFVLTTILARLRSRGDVCFYLLLELMSDISNSITMMS